MGDNINIRKKRNAMKQPKNDVKYSSPENKNRASINNILDRLSISNRTCKTWTPLRGLL